MRRAVRGHIVRTNKTRRGGRSFEWGPLGFRFRNGTGWTPRFLQMLCWYNSYRSRDQQIVRQRCLESWYSAEWRELQSLRESASDLSANALSTAANIRTTRKFWYWWSRSSQLDRSRLLKRNGTPKLGQPGTDSGRSFISRYGRAHYALALAALPRETSTIILKTLSTFLNLSRWCHTCSHVVPAHISWKGKRKEKL